MQDLILNTTKTMSSTEIAELTGKEHKNVVRDLKVLEEQGVLTLLNFEQREIYGNNNTRIVYNLPKRETLILTSGYSAVQRATIIDRWMSLEEQAISAPKVFTVVEQQAEAKLSSLLSISKMLKVPEHHAMGIACKRIDSELGTELVPLLKYSTAMVDIPDDEKLLEVTEIGRMCGGISGQKVNKILEAEGYQTKVNGNWEATDAGKPYSFTNSFVSPYSGKTGYNLKWNVEFAKRVIGETN